MKLRKIFLTASCLLIVAVANLSAQSLEKRHQIELRMGAWNQVAGVKTQVSAGSVSSSVKSNGFLMGLSYGHWLKESLALTISVTALAANVESKVVSSEVTTSTAVVTPVLFGVKYYFPRSTYGGSVRPFAKTGMGMYVGRQSSTEVDTDVTVESRAENAFGGQFGGGVDFLLSRRFMAQIALGYNWMIDFSEPIGGSKNYGGPEMNFGISILFGKGLK